MPTTNLGQIAAIHIGTVAPSNTKMLWYDDNGGQKIIKFYDIGTTSWKAFDGVGVYVPIAGGTMTGSLILNANPGVALGAATKQYVDTAVAGANSLSGALVIGNITGGTDIIMSSGDTINWAIGSGGVLQSVSTTGARTWTLPDATGTVVLGSGITDKVARWSSGALVAGVIDDDGSTAGVGALDVTVAFNVVTTLAQGIKIAKSGTGGAAISAIATGGPSVGNMVGGYFEGASSLADNIGVHGVGRANSDPLSNAIGGLFESTGGIKNSIGTHGLFTSVGVKASGVFGSNIATVFPITLVAGVFGGLKEGLAYDIASDSEDIHASIYGSYEGTASIAQTKYAGYFSSRIINAANSNIAGYFNADGGLTNYSIITRGGLVGINVSSPTKQLEVSSGIGKIRLDTSSVTGAYNLDIDLDDTGVNFLTSAVKSYKFDVGGTAVQRLLATGGLAIGVHTLVDSHLHVKFSGALADMDGGIRGTQSDATPYVYAAPVFADSLVLENESAIANNTNGVVFKAKDTGGTTRNTAFIATRYHSRAASTLSGDLIFGTASSSVLSEAMRIHYNSNVSIGSEAAVGRLFVLVDGTSPDGITVRQDNEGTATKAKISVQAKDSASNYTTVELLASGNGSASASGYVGLDKYFEKAAHLATNGAWGHVNLFARSQNASPLYDIRMFTGGEEWSEANLRMTLKADGKFGFNLVKAGYSGSGADNPLSEFHVGTGALFESSGSVAGGHFVIKNDSTDGTDEGGLILTGASGFTSEDASAYGFKFTTDLTDGGGTVDDVMKIGHVAAASTQTWEHRYMAFNDGNVTVGSHSLGNEKLTLDGALSLKIQDPVPSFTSGYGKLYTRPDNDLYFLDATGTETKLNHIVTGSVSEVPFFNAGAKLITDSSFTFATGTGILSTSYINVSDTVTNRDYVDDAAAGVGGLVKGDIYHTTGILKVKI